MLSELTKNGITEHFYKLRFSLKTGSDRMTPENFQIRLDEESDIIIRKILNKSYKFSRYNKFIVKKNRVVYSPTVRDRIVLDILNDKIIKKYKIKFPNRNSICEGIKRTLEAGFNFTVIRLDIENFYPSIPHNLLYNKLKSSSLLSETEYLLVKRAFSQESKGVLQGLPISNSLAEIYLEGLDGKLKAIDSRLCYFSRYVDDIILIFNSHLLNSEIEDIYEKIHDVLSNLKLSLNREKSSYKLLNDNDSFEYLGYNFNLFKERIPGSRKKKYNRVELEISKKKLKQIKEKISMYFYDYSINNDFNLLFERLKFITSKCYGLKFKQCSRDGDVNSYTKKISFGIYESYSFANQKSFDLINSHIKAMVKLNLNNFNNHQRKMLYNCSYNKERPHYINYHKFTNTDYLNIIQKINSTYMAPANQKRHTVIYDYFKLLDI
ncbi:hypothetical protein FDB29_12850 [Clostridium botulinum]|nr:hypothetical protein [Clostridium botulinum]